MTKEAAIATFRNLVRTYGLEWSTDVPRSAWASLAECNKVLTEADRRAAVGMRP